MLPLFGLCVGHADPAAPAAIKPRLPLATIVSHEQCSSAAEPEAVAAYDALLAGFQRSQGLPAEGWSARAAERVRTPAALHGSHKRRDELLGLGFRLE